MDDALIDLITDMLKGRKDYAEAGERALGWLHDLGHSLEDAPDQEEMNKLIQAATLHVADYMGAGTVVIELLPSFDADMKKNRKLRKDPMYTVFFPCVLAAKLLMELKKVDDVRQK